MTKDEIIENLTSVIAGLEKTIDGLRADMAAQAEYFRGIIDGLNERIAELCGDVQSAEAEEAKAREEAEQAKEEKEKAEREKKAVAGLLQKKQESQAPELTEAEKAELRRLQALDRKRRGNNKARRNFHDGVETQVIYLNPDDPDFDLDKARLIGGTDENGKPLYYAESVRYVYIPGRIVKRIYRLPRYSCNDKIYRAKAPLAAFFNSSYDATVVALLIMLRYMYNVPVERIYKMFGDMGFDLSKPTAHGLLKRTAEVYENFYNAIHEEVFKDPYICADETYHRILVENRDGKNSKKGYFWIIIGVKTKLIYVIYEDGSRSEDVILKEFDPIRDRKIVLQSDAFTAYKKLESDLFDNVLRLSCIQHVKRKLIDCGEDKDAVKLKKMLCDLYHEEHKHEIGKDGWTVDDNLKWRQQYAPPILDRIRTELDRLLKLPEAELPPKSDLYGAVHYLDNEFNAIKNIFTMGDSFLDNNLIERYNRYFSMSRRSSLFFGSHKGAERAAVLYTIALSCRLNGLDVYQYIVDTLKKTATWQPNTPLEKYRDLLPDKWKPTEIIEG